MGDRPPLNRILDQLAGYLEFEISEGARPAEFTTHPLKTAAVPAAKPAFVPAAVRAAPTPPAPEPAAPPAAEPRAARPAADAAGAKAGMKKLETAVASCTKCALHRTRTKTVPGQGCLAPEILFVGEGPGAEEDAQGLAFVGAAGQLLTKMIQAMGFQRDEVFIANVVKCRPPENRQPLPEEMEACLPYLREQIALLNPGVIVVLGAVALKGLLGLDGIMRRRGQWHAYEDIPAMPTFHPSYLLRTPSAKKDTWEDLKEVLRRVGRPIPAVKKG